jgi:hypothetical protein
VKRWPWRALSGFGWALCVACQIGESDVRIGADVPHVFYVSPDGDDQNPGSRQRPWRSLPFATEALQPGQTLVLLSGEYRDETTGLLRVDCSGRPRDGKPGAPITLRAETERSAVLRGDGALVPLELIGCSHWVVEGLVLTNEHAADVPMGVDVGSVAMIHGGTELTLRRLLLQRSNRERHSHVLRVIEAANVLIEECETYDFYHNAFEAVRTHAVVFRRNYFHSRYATSAGNTVGTDDPTRGEVAIQVEESSSTLLENNVAEVVGTGFAVVARAVGSPYTDSAPYPVSGARLYGNLVRDALATGFKVETRCDTATPCTLPARIVTDTLIVNSVALQTATAVSVDAAPGTRVDNVTAVDVRDGVVLSRGDANAGLEFSASAARSLVRGYSGVAFSAVGVREWSFEHCAAHAGAADAVSFAPNDNRVLLPVAAVDDDACVAYLGAQSVLRGAAGVDGDVGANVIYRSLNGALTTEPLWDAQTGAFPCGAVVPGINDDPSQSCSGVHQRLRIGSASCALPTLTP